MRQVFCWFWGEKVNMSPWFWLFNLLAVPRKYGPEMTLESTHKTKPSYEEVDRSTIFACLLALGWCDDDVEPGRRPWWPWASKGITGARRPSLLAIRVMSAWCYYKSIMLWKSEKFGLVRMLWHWRGNVQAAHCRIAYRQAKGRQNPKGWLKNSSMKMEEKRLSEIISSGATSHYRPHRKKLRKQEKAKIFSKKVHMVRGYISVCI